MARAKLLGRKNHNNRTVNFQQQIWVPRASIRNGDIKTKRLFGQFQSVPVSEKHDC